MTNRAVSPSTWTKVFLIAAAAAQAGAIGAAHADITRRRAGELNGSKTKWRMIALIDVVGPLWYFLRARR